MNQKMNDLKHWVWRQDDEGIVWLGIDKQDSGMNVLSNEVLRELETCLDQLEADTPKGLIIHSAKPGSFIAGADINEFTRLDNEEQALQFIRYAQNLFSRLESLRCVTVALIDGYCLGGGLELALACRYRIACEEDNTKLGLPEVKLGIHPGFGGSVRLIQTVGPLPAMNLMLSGRVVSARAAGKIGFVDFVVARRHLQAAPVQVIHSQPAVHQPGFWQRVANSSLARPLIAWYMRKQVAKRARRDHYPAPYALIDLWVSFDRDPDVMMKQEARSVSDLIVSDTAQNLVRVYFLQEKLKSQGRDSNFRAQHVHVIGAGVMGGDIAAWCALRGLKVTLQDQGPERIAPAIGRAHKLFRKKLKKPRLVQKAMDNLVPDVRGLGIRSADIVIEAIFENREAKQALYREIEPLMKPGALLTTNTSSLPLDEINVALSDPARLVGLHFFNPVAKMQLVEIVASAQTDQDAVKAAASFARQIGRLPLPVKSTPGFLVNRVLMPYLLEAVELLSEGVQAELIDEVAMSFGMPMGPVELADTVGLDICLSVAEILTSHLGGEVPALLKDKVGKKQLGRKTGQGFYAYKNGKPVRENPSKGAQTPLAIRERLISRLLNEAMTCLREEVVADAELLDAGLIFGTGFAPFRGGPMHYVEKIGYDKQRSRFEELEQSYGERFHPDDGWNSLKKAS